LKGIKEEIRLKEQVVIEEMSELGVDALKKKGIGNFCLMRKDYPRVVDPEVFFPYLEEKGDGDLLKLTLHSSTLKRWFKKNKGEDLPPGLSNYERYSILVRKA